MEKGNFKIRVVENIGEWSEDCFGTPGTEFDVVNGAFDDLNNFEWDKDCEPFESIEDISAYFGTNDRWKTVLELVEVSI